MRKLKPSVPKKHSQVDVSRRGGWSDWLYPRPKSYFLKCCDCGLVHEMDFKAFIEVVHPRNMMTTVDLPLPVRAAFRARRRDDA